MAIEVAKVELKTVKDASGLQACIAKGQFGADEVIAVIGKTEGNGGRQRLHPHSGRPGVPPRVAQERQARAKPTSTKIPMVWSGGCDGVITPHATIFATQRQDWPGIESAARDRAPR